MKEDRSSVFVWKPGDIIVTKRPKNLFVQGGPGSGFKGHAGRIGQVGGSSSTKSPPRPTEGQIHTALQMGVYHVSEGAHIPLERVKYSVELIPVKDIIPSEDKKPSSELISIYKTGKQVQPISVRKVTGENKMKVLDGNHRLKAARLAGVESIWVVGIEDW